MALKDQIQQPQCPVEWVKVNENQARFTAGLVLFLLALWWYFKFELIPAFLSIDFLLRACGWVRWSILYQLSQWGIRVFQISYLPTDRGPKRFAAGLGLIFSLFIWIAHVSGFKLSAEIATLIMAICAFLEAFFSCCLGCHVYAVLRLFSGIGNR